MINKAKLWLVGCVVVAFGASCQMFAQDGLNALLQDLKDDGAEADAAPVIDAEARARFEDAAVTPEDDALIAELKKLEELRRKAFDEHGVQSLEKARALLQAKDNVGAIEQYKQALEFLIKRPANETMRQESEAGMAEAYYLEAVQLAKRYDKEAAETMAQEANRLGHPRAARLLESLVKEPPTPPRSPESLGHRINDESYKMRQDEIRKRLRRSRQHFATGEFEKSLEECELVLRDYPSNIEAIGLREAIAIRLGKVSEAEFKATRARMIEEVDKAWTPDNYALNSTQVSRGRKEITGQRPIGITDTKTASQIVNAKLRKIIIPEVSFRPPATIIDAVDFFKQASRDYDDLEIPVDQRGVNLILKLPQATQEVSTDDPFGGGGGGAAGIPVINAMTARNISLFDALKLVCEVTAMKTRVSGNIVMIVPVNDPDHDLVRRSYNVLPSLPDRLTQASSELSTRNANTGGGGFMSVEPIGGGTGQEADWKKFFGEMGVAWPIGSSISYALGKLRVTNTEDNLAIFEQLLEELNVTEKLVEIEARFVEVSQDDLQSLGFEWFINGDFSFSVPGFAKNVLGLKNGATAPRQLTDNLGNLLYADQAKTVPLMGYGPYPWPGQGWGVGPDGLSSLRNVAPGSHVTGPQATGLGANPRHNVMMNAINGQDYSIGNRYLNTANNPITQQGVPINDQFMKLNAFIGGADVSMILHMLQQRSDTDLLSAPKVTVSPEQEAIIKVVTEYIYPSEFNVQISQQGNSGGGLYGGGSGEPLAIVEPQNFTMREVGVILQVVPTLSEDGQMIKLTMMPQVVSEPVWKNYGTRIPRQTVVPPNTTNPLDVGSVTTEYIELPMEQPFFNVRSVQTQLTINNGATVVMGGLITESRTTIEDKIPLLGDIPFLGRLFRSRVEQTSKRNLLIFVTARTLGSDGRTLRTMGESLLVSEAMGSSTQVMPEGR